MASSVTIVFIANPLPTNCLSGISHFAALAFEVGPSHSKKMCYLFHWKPFKMMKNSFYFILKALFVLKIFKFLSWLFGHEGKKAWL